MYAIVTGVFAAFAAVLFNARAKRYHESLKQENKNHHLYKIMTEIDR
jgi:hypothetical protein